MSKIPWVKRLRKPYGLANLKEFLASNMTLESKGRIGVGKVEGMRYSSEDLTVTVTYYTRKSGGDSIRDLVIFRRDEPCTILSRNEFNGNVIFGIDEMEKKPYIRVYSHNGKSFRDYFIY